MDQPIVVRPSTDINQTARNRLRELIRMGGLKWNRTNNPQWRDKPWHDGISVDLDNDQVLDLIADTIIENTDG